MTLFVKGDLEFHIGELKEGYIKGIKMRAGAAGAAGGLDHTLERFVFTA